MRIRVLVVDDSVIVRKLVTEVLSSDPSIEVVGVAANGKIALDKISQLNPDLVTLDIEMPVMDGLRTLAEIRRERPALPVIMFSTLTERGASATLDALALGATDYVTKPSNTGTLAASLEQVRAELLPKVRCLGLRVVPTGKHHARASTRIAPMRRSARLTRPDVVAIGVSTGGPNALAEVVPSLPGDLEAPVLIVQHMPPMFTRLLAERLNEVSEVEVEEAYDGAIVTNGRVWIAPGGHHMTVTREGTDVCVRLNQDPLENWCRPAVDVLFRSIIDVYGSPVLAVVLTGMGQDGLRGCEGIVEAGGEVLIQDEATSVVWGMPGAVSAAGLARRALPIAEIGKAIADEVRRPQRRLPSSGATGFQA
ncbi:MAG: chemotaxis response regulator protein-glutamate methylesterase [Dehalococcoidia bacterium]